MKTVVSTTGQIDLPDELRRQDGIAAGERFDLQRIGTGCYLLSRESPPPQAGHTGTLAWLRACPADDWFTPVPSESTDQI